MRYLLTIIQLAPCIARGDSESAAREQACDILGIEPTRILHAMPIPSCWEYPDEPEATRLH